MSIAVIIPIAFAGLTLIGGLVGFFAERSRHTDDSATQTWRDITHRNGVSEISPWHSPKSSFNDPGLVRVYPRTQQPANTTQAPDPGVRPERPAPVPNENPAVEALLADSELPELPELPIELADEATETERKIVSRLIEEGRSQSASILSVWGIKSGGSAKYKLARERFQQYQSEVSNV